MMTMLMLTRIGHEEHGSQIQTPILQLLYPLAFYARAYNVNNLCEVEFENKWMKYFKSEELFWSSCLNKEWGLK